ncbi:MAG: LysR family transcriptional regulator [Neisseriales bacterium]|nr:MAG: LysR family transcriptional regulator [Neisseriales bacterium]
MVEEIILFINLIDAGSFSKLSEQTGISQPTISRRIQSLENSYGTLLIRTPQGIRTTELGKRLYDSFLHHKKSLDGWFRSFGNNQNINEATTIAIMLPPWLASNLINQQLMLFIHKNPSIKLEICYDDRHVDMLKDPFDIVVSRFEPKQSFQIVKLAGQFKAIYYCSNNYIKIGQLPENLAQLTTEHKLISINHTPQRLVTNSVNLTRYLEINNKLEESIHAQADIQVNSIAAARQLMAYSNEYISIDCEFAIKEELEQQKLIKVFPDSYAETIRYYIAITDRHLQGEKKQLFDLLNNIISNWTP